MAVPAEVAAQEVVKALADPKTQQETTPKQGASKFDGVLADKVDGAAPSYLGPGTFPGDGIRVNASRPVESVLRASDVQATDAPSTTYAPPPVDASDQPGRLTQTLTRVLGGLEEGQLRLDKLISTGLSGKEMSQGELLSLQASMYKYTQEMELTSKVVEKATNGLKDTLKTQV